MTGRLLTSLTALTMIGGAVAQLAGCTSRQDLGDPPSLGPDTDAGAAGDAAGASGAPPLRGFVTAASFSGDLVGAAGGTGSGLAAADLICQTAADGAELHGLFVAYLASGSIDALDRIVDDGPFYAVDGKARLYANKAAVGAGASEEISDENGKPVKDYYSGADKFGNPVSGSTAASFWTGATPIGKASGADCGGWMLTDDLSEDGAHASYLGASQVLLGCSTERHLLCLEQRSAPITPVTKRVFITSQEFTGAFVSPGSATSPLAAADARCNASAREGGLQGKFHAWLSAREGSKVVRASDRVSDAHYVLLDGQPVFDSKKALSAGPTLPIAIDERGRTVPSGTQVWTGTLQNGAPSSDDCENWSSTGSARGVFGAVADDVSYWSEAGIDECRYIKHLYCFEE